MNFLIASRIQLSVRNIRVQTTLDILPRWNLKGEIYFPGDILNQILNRHSVYKYLSTQCDDSPNSYFTAALLINCYLPKQTDAAKLYARVN